MKGVDENRLSSLQQADQVVELSGRTRCARGAPALTQPRDHRLPVLSGGHCDEYSSAREATPALRLHSACARAGRGLRLAWAAGALDTGATLEDERLAALPAL